MINNILFCLTHHLYTCIHEFHMELKTCTARQLDERPSSTSWPQSSVWLLCCLITQLSVHYNACQSEPCESRMTRCRYSLNPSSCMDTVTLLHSSFFSYQTLLSDCDTSQFIVGSDDEKSMKKSRFLPSCTSLHLHKNVSHYLMDNIGVTSKVQP